MQAFEGHLAIAIDLAIKSKGRQVVKRRAGDRKEPSPILGDKDAAASTKLDGLPEVVFVGSH